MVMQHNTDFKSRQRNAPKFGDSNIILRFLNSEFWKSFFLGKNDWFLILYKGITDIFREMTLFPVRVFLRIQHGKNSTGYIIYFLSLSMLVALNYKNMLPFVAHFTAFFIWLIPVFAETETIKSIAFTNIHSDSMQVFTAFYSVLGFAQIIQLKFFKKYCSTDTGKRGNSLLYIGLKRIFRDRNRITETFIQTYIEPLLIGGIGYCFWEFFYDPIACFYFSSVALIQFWQEIKDSFKRDIMP